MWDPKIFNQKIRAQNAPKKLERADDIVRRITTQKKDFATLIARK